MAVQLMRIQTGKSRVFADQLRDYSGTAVEISEYCVHLYSRH